MPVRIPTMVGAPTPEIGIPDVVAGIKTLGVAEGVADAGSLINGLADGVASKAGPSAAETTKFLVNFRKAPDASFQEIVIIWFPGAKFFGGFHTQVPSKETVVVPVIGSVD